MLESVNFLGAITNRINIAIRPDYNIFETIPEGRITVWKKVECNGSYLVELKIPEDAKRFAFMGCFGRCSKAKVVSIEPLGDSKDVDVVSTKYKDSVCEYRVGEMVYPDKFDENPLRTNSNGIHFAVNKKCAKLIEQDREVWYW